MEEENSHLIILAWPRSKSITFIRTHLLHLIKSARFVNPHHIYGYLLPLTPMAEHVQLA
jgi:hypothetical protein